MRLINCESLVFEEFVGTDRPDYAILSHTWDAHEISFKDYCTGDELRKKVGSEKIFKTCEIALQSGFRYAWIDTCAIDKSSSAELTEAINSMFKWYRESKLCIVYLSDFDSNDPNAQFASCRWFTRGWTLQELIAPHVAHFYDVNWCKFGNKQELASEIGRITGISANTIVQGKFDHLSVARRMSWAAGRRTTREEDMAYCLFGIFGVNLPLLYGEGDRAFIRLQEEILRTRNDMSIFAWKRPSDSSFNKTHSILASSPEDFRHARDLLTMLPRFDYSLTNRGLKIGTELTSLSSTALFFMPLWCKRFGAKEEEILGIVLLKHTNGIYYRIMVDTLCSYDSLTTLRLPEPKTTESLIFIYAPIFHRYI